MSQNTVIGVSVGSIVGFGSAASPIGDIPSAVFLALQGVSNPIACLNWIKDSSPAVSTYFHPCSPNTDAASLSIVSGGLVFIAVGLIVWKAIEVFGSSRST
jgi:hypothetical protein